LSLPLNKGLPYFCPIKKEKQRQVWKSQPKTSLLKKRTWLLRSLFSANHEWAMRKGLESLEMELRRLRGGQQVLPPKPMFPHNILNNNIL